jgi:death-on-curing protein
MTDWIWIDASDAISFHDQQIAIHGGASGLRDEGLLQSALARPQMKAQYGVDDIAELAAAYGFGIARNHPFVDGNKRTALVVMEAFLVVHGHELKADEAETVALILALAGGEVTEEQLADWVRDNLMPLGIPFGDDT